MEREYTVTTQSARFKKIANIVSYFFGASALASYFMGLIEYARSDVSGVWFTLGTCSAVIGVVLTAIARKKDDRQR